MTIWFDFANSPQVLFFSKIIKRLQEENEIIITCRPLANTIELLDIEGFDYTIIGKHYGTRTIFKVLGIFRRVIALWFFLRNTKIDLSVSHSSFYLQVVSKILNIKSIYINDNEHAAWNRLAIKLSNLALFPEPLKEISNKLGWEKLGKVEYYPGIKEGVYLWDYVKDNNDPSNIQNIYVRTEPWNADYYKGKLFFFDKILIDLSRKYNLILLPRGEKPLKHYEKKQFSDIKVLMKSLSQKEIFEDCDLFIGAGGSMTREAATVGIPTISIYQGELLAVDKYLIDKGLMIHEKELTLIKVDQLIKSYENKTDSIQSIREKGIKAFEIILKKIIKADDNKE